MTHLLFWRLLNPQTPAEITAGVTPVNYTLDAGWVNRYGNNTTPGTTNMSAAIQSAINVVKQQGYGKIFL